MGGTNLSSPFGVSNLRYLKPIKQAPLELSRYFRHEGALRFVSLRTMKAYTTIVESSFCMRYAPKLQSPKDSNCYLNKILLNVPARLPVAETRLPES